MDKNSSELLVCHWLMIAVRAWFHS